MYKINIDAYCLTEETVSVLEAASQDVNLVRSTFHVSMGGYKTMVATHSETGKPTGDVLLLEVGDDPVAAMEQVAEVFPHLSPSTSIIVIGRVNNIPFHEEMMEGGVSEYILIPFTPAVLVNKLSKILQNDNRGVAGKGHVVCVFGAKGGVGTSTVAQNLAWSLQKVTDRAVTLADLDLHFGTVSINLNQDPRSGIRDALARASQNQLEPSMMERYYNKETEGAPNLWTLASNPKLDDVENILTPDAVQQVMDIVGTQASYTVVDMPQMWHPALTGLLSIAHETLVICDHTIQSLRNASLLFEFLKGTKPHGTHMGYVLNHAGLLPQSDLGIKDFTDALGIKPQCVIPWNPKVFRVSSSEGKLIGSMPQHAKSAAVFDELAKFVAREEAEAKSMQSKKSGKGAKESSSFFAKLFKG